MGSAAAQQSWRLFKRYQGLLPAPECRHATTWYKDKLKSLAVPCNGELEPLWRPVRICSLLCSTDAVLFVSQGWSLYHFIDFLRWFEWAILLGAMPCAWRCEHLLPLHPAADFFFWIGCTFAINSTSKVFAERKTCILGHPSLWEGCTLLSLFCMWLLHTKWDCFPSR